MPLTAMDRLSINSIAAFVRALHDDIFANGDDDAFNSIITFAGNYLKAKYPEFNPPEFYEEVGVAWAPDKKELEGQAYRVLRKKSPSVADSKLLAKMALSYLIDTGETVDEIDTPEPPSEESEVVQNKQSRIVTSELNASKLFVSNRLRYEREVKASKKSRISKKKASK